MSAKAPAFLNKPNHKGTVVATSRGWVVEATGELLVSVKNLDQRIAEHLGLPSVKLANTLTDVVVETPQAAVITPEVFEAPAVLTSADAVNALLDAVDELPKPVAPVADVAVVEEAKPVVAEVEVPAVVEVPAAPEVVKPRRGRPPKVRTEEAPVAPTAEQAS